MTAPTPSDVGVGTEAGACPRCGASFDPNQEYCLECGLRLPMPPSGVVATLGGAWQRRLRWYPGDWIWAALALGIVAALGGAVAVLADRGESSTTPLVATTTPGVTTGPAVTTTPSATAVPEQRPATTAATSPPPPPPPPPPLSRRGELVEWPTGKSGWTVVVRSVPVTGGTAAARADARRAAASGLRDVGVLESSDYSSLHPGFFVVFSGIYDSQADAESAAEKARSGDYPGAYVRQVSP